MNALFDIWCGMSRRCRGGCWCAGVLCLTLTVALSVGYPGWKTLDMQHTRLSQQREAARQQWRNLRRLSVAAEPLFGRTTENTRPFSPLDFQTPHQRLPALAAVGAGGAKWR
ncbi:membrane protein [Salmonella enterica subsp. arizonae]|uniref:Membrane protein n=1 Tax=Salmonella enterica subsp. arizonae TaxID=59203 RepID=A0A379T720_SALER|nr:membrane protein [Salmonella enterica subsp. arizonae]